MSKLLRNIFPRFFHKRQSKNIDVKKIQSDEPSKSIDDISEFQPGKIVSTVSKSSDDISEFQPGNTVSNESSDDISEFQPGNTVSNESRDDISKFQPVNKEFQSDESTESNGGKKCRDVLQNIFGHKFINTSPDFLKNPVTGCNLELDCFNEYLNIAVEYNGPEHYSPKFHETKHDYNCVQYRDYIKKQLCKENNTILIIVRYDIDDIESFIVKNLEQQTVVINNIDYKLYFIGAKVFYNRI